MQCSCAADDPQNVLRVLGQVITVSLETVEIVKALPEFVISQLADGTTA